MFKLVTFAGYDNRSGPHIFPIEADVARTIGHIKMARPLPPEVEHYIKTAQPIPGKTQLLIDAMGAGEWYGSNVNGDYFPEPALSHKGADYGHETFMHYAYPFKHHVNKDPARAHGEKVKLSAYDPSMHRVLLIVIVDDSKCQDILGDLAGGRYWDVSMGCKVPWDECSICKNRAKNRGEYCPHLKYQMNRILPDGKRVFAFNHLPKFFDISFVTIGAEKASHILKKVASDGPGGTAYEYLEKDGARRYFLTMPSAAAGEVYYEKLAAAEKAALEKKEADIDKEVPCEPKAEVSGVTPEDKAKLEGVMNDAGDVKATERTIPNQVLDAAASFPLKEVFSTLAALGIDLQPHEFQRIILVKQGAKPLADKLAQHRLVFDERHPGSTVPTWASQISFDPNAVSEKVASLLRPFVAERSVYPEILLARLEKRAGLLPSIPYYNRDNQWYPMSDEEKRKSSGMPGLVPASVALAAGFMVFRNAFPALMAKAPGPIQTLSRYPWLLPILIGAGVGATVGLGHMTKAMPLSDHGTGSGLDDKNSAAYHATKTAGINVLSRVGIIPLIWMYSGVQQRRWQRGDRLNAVDRFIAQRPDVASVAGFAAAPKVTRGIANLFKHGSGAGVVTGPHHDTALVDVIQRLAARIKEN